MRMKKMIICLLALIPMGFLQAQQEDEAKKLLDQLSEKTKAYKTVEINFTFIVKNTDQGLMDTTKGVLKLKDEKYRLTLKDQDIFCDGIKVYTYNKELNECQVVAVSELDADAVTPKNMFTIYESDFKSKIKEKKKDNGKNITVIDLFPLKPKEKDYSIVRIDVDVDKLQVIKAMVLAKNGTHYTYRIDKLTPDKSFDDTIFIFDKTKYPKVKVIE